MMVTNSSSIVDEAVRECLLMQRVRVGVFIDSENITYQYLQLVMELANSLGDVVVAEGYCGEELKKSKNLSEHSEKNEVKIIGVEKKKNLKAEVDMRMNNRIGYFQGSGKVDIFIIVSSDSDFTDAIRSLRSEGMIVVGVGKSFTNSDHKKVCSVFYDLGPK
ncbi:NYN domain-containing protein [uncultured Pseudodesulfovibrio sp.]|uniref:NYN domain-containing protein n=1 Tax=uncultured Pseudodesulfovibrio sp. TaxID=2035858 RepID=UPI0029C75E1B|nr:NYN domain-containing protein [uncultured Pseudodesulfovibrio sp.]